MTESDWLVHLSNSNNMVQRLNSKVGSHALNGPKSMFLYFELKVMRSNLIGPIKLKEHGHAFRSTFQADENFSRY